MAADGGVIVNLSSAAARIGSPNEFIDYAASKGAIDAMTLGLSKEVAGNGIRVNAVRPGLIHTDIHASSGQPDRVERLQGQVPMGRGGSAEEVAEMCRMAAVTGSVLRQRRVAGCDGRTLVMRMHQITPFVPCSDLQRQIGFYRNVLGFEVGFQADNYAFLRRDEIAVRLLGVDASTDLASPEGEQSFYIDVHGLDALYESLAAGLEALPPGRVREPFNQGYGQREFHVIDEDGTLIFFGERVQAQP